MNKSWSIFLLSEILGKPSKLFFITVRDRRQEGREEGGDRTLREVKEGKRYLI